MLAPKRVKFRKQQKGRMRGMATRGNTVAYGDFGLQSMEPGWITNRQIEAARVALTRQTWRQSLDPYLSRQAGDEETG
jgi:large subunit ribosomal protein L16